MALCAGRCSAPTKSPIAGFRRPTSASSGLGVIIWRNRDGKMVEAWNFPDRLGLLQQLGAFPQAATGQRPSGSQAVAG